jgi:dipeptidyl-peptidase-4
MTRLLATFYFFLILGILQAAEPSITLEQIWKDRYFASKSIRLGQSMNDGLQYSIVENQTDINIYSYESGEKQHTAFSTEGILTNDQGKGLRISEYIFSPDETTLLIGTNREAIYRHSYIAEYFVWDTESETLKPLSEGTRLSLPAFSPDGRKVAFVRENNLFIKDLDKDVETAVTSDGLHNFIINGSADWVYEEEFGLTKGFHWSPDGQKLAFYRFDESRVKEFNMILYGSLYPEDYRFKYPKAGEENSRVSIHIYDVTTGRATKVDTGPETDQYIPRIQWTKNPELLCVMRMNRHQNQLELLLADARSGASEVLYEENNLYYIEVTDDLTFLEDGRHFIISSEKSGYNHLYLYDLQGREVRALTNGDWDVQRFFGIDEDQGLVFFSSHERSPLRNHLYSVKLNGRGKQQLTQGEGTHSPSFSKGFRYFINNFSNANTPPVYSIHYADGSLIKVLEDNRELLQKMNEHRFVERTFFSFETSEGVSLNGWMMQPEDFDPTKEYPVFMYAYGGPGSQTVVDRWDASNGAWYQMLTQMGFIIVSVDNRGTGARGEAFRKMTYMQLGKYETIDQIEAAKYLGALPYVDKDRISIFGWSYGGYLSSLCLAKGADYFAGAIAVAPVTNWRYYDSVYTERYMRLPQENPEGYDDNSPIFHADNIKGHYLLVHGSADDNVHFQNTMEMASVLVEANVPFELAVYPNHNHGIAGGNTRLHLYEHMTRFLVKNFL